MIWRTLLSQATPFPPLSQKNSLLTLLTGNQKLGPYSTFAFHHLDIYIFGAHSDSLFLQLVEKPMKWAVCTVKPLRSFVSARVALLGDAVRNPLLPCTPISFIKMISGARHDTLSGRWRGTIY